MSNTTINQGHHPTKPIRIIQLNCMKSTNVTTSCLQSVSKTADLILIQEPWFHKLSGRTITHPAFQQLIPTTPHNTRPRVMAYLNTKSTHFRIHQRPDILIDQDTQVLEITSDYHPNTLIYNIYNEQDQNNHWTLNRIHERIQVTQHTIITGDMNAHHPLWNSQATETRATTLINLINEHKLSLLNEPDIPTFHRRNTKGISVLDLTFYTQQLEEFMGEWAIDEDNHPGSDHVMISYSILPTNAEFIPSPLTPRYKWKSADMLEVAEEFEKTMKRTRNTWDLILNSPRQADMEWGAEFLTTCITEIVEKLVPKLKASPRAKKWWTPIIDQERKEMGRKWREWRQGKGQGDEEMKERKYKSQRNKYFRKIREEKDKCWQKYVETAKQSEVFTVLKAVNPRKQERTSTINYNGEMGINFKDKARLLRKALFPPPPKFTTTDNTPPSRNPIAWDPVTSTEVLEAIMTSAPNKAAGPDGIPFSVLQILYGIYPEYFNRLYAQLLQYGYHPKCWRTATGAILRKPNKPDYSAPKAYRIIALLNCLGKTAEKIMARRVAFYAEEYDLLHSEQMGGRPKRSATDAALALTHDIESANRRGNILSAVFLDVKGAFDNVAKPRLLLEISAAGQERRGRNGGRQADQRKLSLQLHACLRCSGFSNG